LSAEFWPGLLASKISDIWLAAFDNGRVSVTHLTWRLADESNSFTLKIGRQLATLLAMAN